MTADLTSAKLVIGLMFTIVKSVHMIGVTSHDDVIQGEVCEINNSV